MKALALPNMIQTAMPSVCTTLPARRSFYIFIQMIPPPGCALQVGAFAVAYVGFEKLNAVSSASART